MTSKNSKILFASISAIVGLALFVALGDLSSLRQKGAKPETKTASAPPPVPENPAHEKAALEEQLKRDPGHLPILLRLAEIERAAGNGEAARKYLEQAVEKDPANVDVRLELSKSLYEAGKLAEAMAQSKLLLEKHPDQVDALYNLGAIYANQSNFALARQYWERAVTIDGASESGRKAQDGLHQIGRP